MGIFPPTSVRSAALAYRSAKQPGFCESVYSGHVCNTFLLPKSWIYAIGVLSQDRGTLIERKEERPPGWDQGLGNPFCRVVNRRKQKGPIQLGHSWRVTLLTEALSKEMGNSEEPSLSLCTCPAHKSSGCVYIGPMPLSTLPTGSKYRLRGLLSR